MFHVKHLRIKICRTFDVIFFYFVLYLYSKGINRYVSRETIKNKCYNHINEVIYL